MPELNETASGFLQRSRRWLLERRFVCALRHHPREIGLIVYDDKIGTAVDHQLENSSGDCFVCRCGQSRTFSGAPGHDSVT